MFLPMVPGISESNATDWGSDTMSPLQMAMGQVAANAIVNVGEGKFEEAITGKSPEGLAFNSVTETKLKNGKDPDGGEPTVVFDNEEKTYLQRMAYASVMEFNGRSTNKKERRSRRDNSTTLLQDTL